MFSSAIPDSKPCRFAQLMHLIKHLSKLYVHCFVEIQSPEKNQPSNPKILFRKYLPQRPPKKIRTTSLGSWATPYEEILRCANATTSGRNQLLTLGWKQIVARFDETPFFGVPETSVANGVCWEEKSNIVYLTWSKSGIHLESLSLNTLFGNRAPLNFWAPPSVMFCCWGTTSRQNCFLGAQDFGKIIDRDHCKTLFRA